MSKASLIRIPATDPDGRPMIHLILDCPHATTEAEIYLNGKNEDDYAEVVLELMRERHRETCGCWPPSASA